jgi:hypothetical protein
MGRKPSVIVKPVHIVRPLNGEIWVDGHKYKVTILRGGGVENASYHYDFTKHPLRRLINAYLLDDAEDVTSGTIHQRCDCLRVLKEFMDSYGYRDLSASSMRKFMDWLKMVRTSKGKLRFTETVVATLVNSTVRLYEVGLCQARPGWSQRDLDLIVKMANKSERGLRQRRTQQAIENAMSVGTFTALAKVVSLEKEECRKVLQERKAGKRASLYNLGLNHAGIMDPNPFVVFSLEAGLRYGLRSQELNTLGPEDVRIDPITKHHCLYVHAPDKDDDFIPVEEDFLETLNLCLEWSREAREIIGDAGKGLYEHALLVYLPANNSGTKLLVPLNTYNLNRTHLRFFYKKWFKRAIKDNQEKERPLLHAEDDETKPLNVSFRKIRKAFAARFIEREPNRVVAQRVLRHRSFETTREHYTHRKTLEHAKKVQLALGGEAQLLVMSLKTPIKPSVSRRTFQKAKEAGALTPHGICGPALEGFSCQVASDCLVCPHLVVIVSRKQRFEVDKEAYLKKADRLMSEGDHRGAENALSRAKLCQAHILRIEDMKGGISPSECFRA